MTLATPLPTPTVDPAPHEARREPREPVRIDASLLMYRARYEVIVTDVSRNGAMIEGERVPAKGAEVVLARNGFQAVATVAWNRGTACGLAFHRAIDPDALVGRRARMMRRSAS